MNSYIYKKRDVDKIVVPDSTPIILKFDITDVMERRGHRFGALLFIVRRIKLHRYVCQLSNTCLLASFHNFITNNLFITKMKAMLRSLIQVFMPKLTNFLHRYVRQLSALSRYVYHAKYIPTNFLIIIERLGIAVC